MRFGYAYKTADGLRHESEFEAKTKEDVFAALRRQGIRPIKVWEIHSRFYVSRRTRLVVLFASLAAASVFYALHVRREMKEAEGGTGRATAPRHQLYGDPATLEEIERDGFASVFPNLGDRILAAYAIPGRPVPAEVCGIPRQDAQKAVAASMGDDVTFSADDPPEAVELKKIVQGMKDELRWYVGDGVGTVGSYLSRLNERQDEEIRIYERTRKELEDCTDMTVREERNAALRAMGLRTIPRPRNGGNLP